jgi:hypothetical protein
MRVLVYVHSNEEIRGINPRHGHVAKEFPARFEGASYAYRLFPFWAGEVEWGHNKPFDVCFVSAAAQKHNAELLDAFRRVCIQKFATAIYSQGPPDAEGVAPEPVEVKPVGDAHGETRPVDKDAERALPNVWDQPRG